MFISLANEILERYPGVEIGYLIARVVVTKTDPFVEGLKRSLSEHLQNCGINATNFAVHPRIACWRTLYEEEFHVKAKTYRSSIESLLRRIVTGKGIWNICNIVDLYNCCSALSLLPMGGYDLSKVSGNIEIRYAREGELFLGLGEKIPVEAKPNQIIYADDKRVMCWLWNHKDSAATCIDENSEYVIFFIDALEQNKVQACLIQLAENLEKIGCTNLESGILNKASPNAEISYKLPVALIPL